MLNEEVYDRLSEVLVARIESANTFVLKEIAKNIKLMGGMNKTNMYQLEQILRFGGSYERITQKLAEVTRLNVQDIYKMFEEMAKKDQRFAEKFYKYRSIDFIPYEQNEALKQQVRAIARQTAESYINLSQTLAFARRLPNGQLVYSNLSDVYQYVIDEGILSVMQGKTTFDQQMSKVIKQLSHSELKTVDYASGYHRRLDSAVRMNLKDGLRQLHNSMQEEFGEEFKADGVEITVHLNPAPDHEKVQGRQFSKKEYLKLQSGAEAVDYKDNKYTLDHDDNGKYRPISQLNCYHTVFDIVLGVSSPEYTDKQLKEIRDKNDAGFEFEGKHYTMYEGTQLQRQLETEIRKAKDEQIMARESGIDEAILSSQARITKLTQKYNELCQASGLPRKAKRMKVSGYRRVAIKKSKSL